MNKNESSKTIVQEQHTIANITALSDETSKYQRTQHPDAQWYANASLGMFFHWGISSVSGQGDLSWGMMNRTPGYMEKAMKRYGMYAVQTLVPPTEYWAQAKNFLCENYDPNEWILAAKDAGVDYVVLTTKHHDGFCLWPSEYGELSTRNYLNGRDLVGEFVEACRRHDMRIGFYYSPPDWYFFRHHMSYGYGNQKPALDVNYEPYEVPERSAELLEAYHDLCNGHVRELLTRYGKIDILWFDGRLPEESISMAEIRELQPGILVNPRGHGYGDFDTPECKFPEKRLEPGWWEYCHVFADGAWGYLDHEVYKPLGWLLAEWSKTRSWDGKFLPNVAPDSHGQMPHSFYLRMKQLKAWMAHSGESVKGTTGGAWPEESNVPLTQKPGKLYAHIDWIFDGTVEIKNLHKEPAALTLLRTGSSIDYEYADGVLLFRIPQKWRTNLTDVVSIDM
ncbi:alpha-L-fucosidase [Coraliomargarita parva]|uniref:alpha-L-fucosidase n=1 Tax=Coraliomargarita parva TaxID=3014050 RepID=UPI0022B38AAF|nr:alpha-L-fucosidase [Coraliomargarita parva]